MLNGDIVTLSTNSLTGIVQNRDWRSTGSSYCVTAPTSNPVNSHPAQSICVSVPCADSHYEAADCGLLSADLAAGIRRVKGVKRLGMRLGNWLTAEQGHALWQAPDSHRLKGKRDRALLSLLLACGLRRHEAVALTLDHLQQREEHWAIVDLVGKGGHVRTVPVPDWVKTELYDWLAAAAIDRGRLFRRVNKAGKAWGEGITGKAVWHIVKESAKTIGITKLAPHDLSTDLCSALPRIGNSSPTLLFYDGWRVPTNARGNVLEFLGRRTRAVIAGKVRI